MNRFNWKYLDSQSNQHSVGLMHGPESGHLLVYCNTKIVLIDFKVLKDAQYSFFINDELCELSIERRGQQFLYGFEINKKADTPLNRARRKKNKKDLIKSLAFMGGLFLLVSIFIMGLFSWNEYQMQSSINEKIIFSGHETKAKVLLASESDGEELSYFFTVNGKAYTDRISPKSGDDHILDNGMPLETGDEFVVKYLPYNPRLNTIYYERPTAVQLRLYKERATRKYMELNPETDPDYCACLTEVAYETEGINGIANFYFQDVSPQENANHNSNTFKKLTRSEQFMREVDRVCSGI